jgi:hypothetical protein
MNVASRTLLLSLAICWFAAAADLGGRWSTGRGSTFVFHVTGNHFTGVIEGRPGERKYKIVDGTVDGDKISFFVLHEDKDDPEVIENGGKPFHNTAAGTITGDEMSLSGSREGTNIRQYNLVLKRVRSQSR